MARVTMNASIDIEDVVFVDKLVKDDNNPQFKSRGDVIQKALQLLKKSIEG